KKPAVASPAGPFLHPLPFSGPSADASSAASSSADSAAAPRRFGHTRRSGFGLRPRRASSGRATRTPLTRRPAALAITSKFLRRPNNAYSSSGMNSSFDAQPGYSTATDAAPIMMNGVIHTSFRFKAMRLKFGY